MGTPPASARKPEKQGLRAEGNKGGSELHADPGSGGGAAGAKGGVLSGRGQWRRRRWVRRRGRGWARGQGRDQGRVGPGKERARRGAGPGGTGTAGRGRAGGAPRGGRVLAPVGTGRCGLSALLSEAGAPEEAAAEDASMAEPEPADDADREREAGPSASPAGRSEPGSPVAAPFFLLYPGEGAAGFGARPPPQPPRAWRTPPSPGSPLPFLLLSHAGGGAGGHRESGLGGVGGGAGWKSRGAVGRGRWGRAHPLGPCFQRASDLAFSTSLTHQPLRENKRCLLVVSTVHVP